MDRTAQLGAAAGGDFTLVAFGEDGFGRTLIVQRNGFVYRIAAVPPPPPGCGIGPELALAIPVLAALRRRRALAALRGVRFPLPVPRALLLAATLLAGSFALAAEPANEVAALYAPHRGEDGFFNPWERFDWSLSRLPALAVLAEPVRQEPRAGPVPRVANDGAALAGVEHSATRHLGRARDLRGARRRRRRS